MDFLDRVMNFHSNLIEEEKNKQSTPTVISDGSDIVKMDKKPRKKSLQQIFIISNNYKKKKK